MASPYDNIPGKIFIGGISPFTTQESIQRYFGQFGDLCDCVLMQDKATGKSRGFGFVTYKDYASVDKVLSTTHSIDGKEVDCKRAIPRDQQGESTKDDLTSKTRKLFVGGLPQSTSEEQFRAYFEQFGTIEDSVIMVDKDTGKSRGFGFVTFDSEEAVERVIQRYYDNKIDGKWVECKRAQPKDLGSIPTKKVGNKLGGGPVNGKNPGYFQDKQGSHKGSRGFYNQESYGDDPYPGGYMQNMMREGGGYANYPQSYPDFGQNGFDPSYGYSAGYPGDMSAPFGNVFPGFYNAPYGGGAYNPVYNQYPPGQYMGPGFSDPSNASRMGSYPHSDSTSQASGGYSQDVSYNSGYNNNMGKYGGGMNAHASNGSAKDMHHNTPDQQQSQSMSLSPQGDQSGVGPKRSNSGV